MGPGKLDALLEEAVLDPAVARTLLLKYPANRVPDELVSWLDKRLIGKVVAANEASRAGEDRKAARR
jgi:hypothetical protein